MKKFVLLILMSSMFMTGCSLDDVKAKIENKVKDTVASTIAQEMGLPEELVRSITDQVSLEDVKIIGQAFQEGDYEKMMSYLGEVDFSQIEGLDSIDPSMMDSVTNFIGDVDIESLTETLGDTEDINAYVGQLYQQLEESGVDMSEMSNYIETYAKQYQEEYNLTDEQMQEMKEQIKEALNK